MKKLITVLFLLISTISFTEPQITTFIDKEFKKDHKEITKAFLSYPINPDVTMADVFLFFYENSTTMYQWIVRDREKNVMMMSMTFSRTIEGSIFSSATISLEIPYSSKFMNEDYIREKAEFSGSFVIEGRDTLKLSGDALKTALTKLLSDTDEDLFEHP